MSIRPDRWIRRMAEQHGMIDPFEPGQVREVDNRRVISFGTSSYGYDVRCARQFKVFTNINSTIVDPKAFDPSSFVDMDTDVCIIPPNSFALASTVEYFRIPRNVLTVCLGKSTYARCGIIVNVTPLEPEWRGKVTIEISNTTPLPAKIYANEGIAQMVFIKADRVCHRSYADKGGKYQDQAGLTLPMVDAEGREGGGTPTSPPSGPSSTARSAPSRPSGTSAGAVGCCGAGQFAPQRDSQLASPAASRSEA